MRRSDKIERFMSEEVKTEAQENDLTAPGLAQALTTSILGRPGIEIHPVLDSTNERIKQLGLNGAEEGTIVLAETQTSGRGRLGRVWHSPAGLNIYHSILLRPALSPAACALLPLMAGLAGARAIGRVTGMPPVVKWPNDLLFAGRKVAGILSEMELRGPEVLFVVLGVGINVNLNREDLPADLQDQAGSIRMATGRRWNRTDILAAFLGELEAAYLALQAGQKQVLLDAYRAACITLGSSGSVHSGDGYYRGHGHKY